GYHASAGFRLREPEMDGLLFGRDLDPLNPLQFLDAALHLFRLGGLIPEAVDEGFELLDAILLVAIGGFELAAPLGLLLLVPRLTAGVEVEALVPQLGDLAYGDVEEVTVVGHQDEGIRIRVQVTL